MRNRSRLSRRLESQTKNTIVISFLGILALLFILVKFGIPLLANVTLFISGARNSSDTTSKSNTSEFIASPVLDALPTATNSATIIVSGTSFPNQKINLYVNGQLKDDTEVLDNNTFIFKNVSLEKGENLIQTKAVLIKDPSASSGQKESDFSDSYTVVFKKDPPTLQIDSPSDNQSFSKDDKFATVKGKTDVGAKVTINDLWAIVDDAGNFSYNFPLQSGDNQIKIKATDEAGNTTEKEIKVTYSQ